MNKKIKNRAIRLLSIMLLATLLMFIIVASAEIQDPIVDGTTATDVTSAGAFAFAIGSEAYVHTEVIVSDNGASASAIARAKAENGETATAMAESWAKWMDGSSAYAKAIATSIAEIGQTIWVEATAYVSVSTGESCSYAESKISSDLNDNTNRDDRDNSGDGIENSIEDIDNDEVNSDMIIRQTPMPDTIGGFIFGKGDIERYCTYKLQLSDNDPDNDARAKYYMYHVIAWVEYGFTGQEFEEKYGLTDEFCKQAI